MLSLPLQFFCLETDDGDLFDDILKAIEETYNENLEELMKEIILDLKDKPELRNRLDIRSTLRLSRYEGSASNVLRDIMMTSNSMIQEIISKRVILQESIRQDEKIVNTIKKDNKLIVKYLKELGDMEEIEKIYLESFEKVVENMGKSKVNIVGSAKIKRNIYYSDYDFFETVKGMNENMIYNHFMSVFEIIRNSENTIITDFKSG
jgi:hypothetical protein